MRRYTKYLSWSEIHRLYRLTSQAETGRNDEPRYNIAPTQDVPFFLGRDCVDCQAQGLD
ncbi:MULTISPECIES: hypothetical protein [unclassified Mesorhizobium]|uniref:hypothetical protein n=1 Tax=unclassified Mesorhizobium TaxID=325217 RepID=UPI0004177B52|nr:hypothetical protein [Mesorhizobium sp. LNJC391B00]